MFKHLSRVGWALLLLTAFSTVFRSQVAQSQTLSAVPARVIEAVSDTKRVTLPGSVTPSIQKAEDLGLAPSSNPMSRIVLVLKSSDAQQKDLKSLTEAQQTKGSDQYHKWLTPEEFGKRFGPSTDDLAKVTSWLQGQGFTGVKVAKSSQTVEFSGTVGTTQTAFRTSIHQFNTKTSAGTERHTANATPVSIPAALAPVITGVLSLNDFQSKPMHTAFYKVKRDANGKLVRVKGDDTSTDGNGDFSYALAPADIRKIYGATSLPAGVDGTDVSISIIGRSDVDLTDIQSFRKIFSLPDNDPNIIVSGVDPGTNSFGDQSESTLDLEWAGAVAPKATLNFVTAATSASTDGVVLAAAYAVENVTSPILTISYGSCEMHNGPSGNAFWNSLWQQAAAEGISVFVSSGDGGAALCDADVENSPATGGETVNAIASTPYNVAVGGTQFAENGLPMQYWSSNNGSGFLSALGYIPEAAWNESCDPTLPSGLGNCAEGQTAYTSVGTGGGRSSCSFGTVDDSGNVTCTRGYPKPSWQQGMGVPGDQARDIPDVSFNASMSDDPYIFCVMGGCQYTLTNGQYSLNSFGAAGGTSFSSPVMAAIMALVEQQNGQWQGQPNYTLYNLASQSGASCSSSLRTDPTQGASCIFNDVVAGNNSVPGLPDYGTPTPDFTAAAGYDLATGLGSMNIANLVANWKSTTPAASTTTTLSSTVTAAKHGTALPISVVATAASGTPSGDIVLLTDKYGAGDQYTLDATGKWSGNVSDLPGGTYNLTARYGGNASFAESTSTGTSLTITPEDSRATLTTLTTDPNTGNFVPGTQTAYFGAPVRLVGSVAGLSGQGTATGTMTVMVDGKTTLASGPLTADSGITLTSTDIPVGTHAITIQYSGDNSFDASTSAPVQMTIPKGEIVTVPNFIVGPNHITAVLISMSGTVNPTGTAQLFDNGLAMGPPQPVVYTGPIGDGVPQIAVQYTYANGPHTIQATYSGDANYLPVALNSNAAFQQQFTVGSAGTTPTVTSFTMTSPSTLHQGEIATFVFSAAPLTPNGKVPTGQVDIFGNDSLFTGGPLVNGKASAIFYADFAGVYTIRAQYQGDNDFAPSMSSTTVTLTVPKLTAPMSFSASTPYTLPGSQVSLNFTATGQMINPWLEQDPIGTVTFTDSVNGIASPLGTFNIVFVNGMVGGYSGRFSLTPGTHLITATYNGNPNYNAATITTTVTVQQPDFTLTTASGDAGLQINAGTSVSATLSLTPLLGYTGNLLLACAGGVPAGSKCVVSSSSLSLGAAQTATVTVTTPAPSPSVSANLQRPNEAWKAAGALASLLMVCLPRRRRFPVVLSAVLAITLSFIGCATPAPPTTTPLTTTPPTTTPPTTTPPTTTPPTATPPAATLLALSSSNVKAASGTSVTLTATLSALSGNATGTVTFYDGTTALGNPASVAEGNATLQLSSLGVGAHSITASYGGDQHNVASTSTAVTQVITGTTTLQVTAISGSLSHSVSIPLTLQ